MCATIERVGSDAMTSRGEGASLLERDGDVSVVIVVYRTPEMLAQCLNSFERHRPRRIVQVVVIDNSMSVDQPLPAERYAWIDYVPNAENLHFRRSVNQGAHLARGPYLLLLNPDTYLVDRDSIAKLADVLDHDPSIGFVGPKMQGDDGLIAPQGERLAGLGYLCAARTYLNAVWPGNPVQRWHRRAGASRESGGLVDTVSAAALLCRRDEFLAVGGLDERAAAYWEEQELARKFRRRGQRGYYAADSFVFHHWRKGGSQHVPPEQLRRDFELGMRVYYDVAYGRLGLFAYDLLTTLQRWVRRTTPRLGNAAGQG